MVKPLSDELFIKICEKLYSGFSVKRAADALGLVNFNPKSFFVKLKDDPRAREAFEEASRARTEYNIEELQEIADNEPDIARARLMCDVRKWAASKLLPHKYGERIDVNLNNNIDLNLALREAKLRAGAVPLQPVKQLDIQDAEIIDESDDSKTG